MKGISMKGINCSKCSSSVHWLEIFPNNLCLDCYKVSDQANKDITADELVAMFKGSVGK
tara:strand:- start:162 stop:338 length:177 start_codon:yes stop_codon:yes gene_type:complete